MTTENHMTLEDFHASLEYKVLTGAQQTFVDALIETQDPIEAAKRAYPRHRKDENYLRVLLFKAEDSPRLQSAIAKAFNLSDREQTIRSLRRQVQRLDGAAKVGALALLAQITGALPANSIDLGTFVTLPAESGQAAQTPAGPASTQTDDLKIEVAPPARIAMPNSGTYAAAEEMSRRIFVHN